MKLHIFAAKKFLRKTLIYFSTEISLESALKKYENYYPQGFLKKCQYVGKSE